MSDEPILVLYGVVYYHLRDRLTESLAPFKSITVSDLNLPKRETTNAVKSDHSCTSLFGRTFGDLNYKYIVYLVYENYMNNVNRFILQKKDCEVYIFQSSSNVLTQQTLTSVIKKKLYIKERIKDSTYFGILICSLSIKDLLDCINHVKSLCKKANKKCYIFSVGRPNVAKLANFPEIEIFVNITCAEGIMENQKEYMRLIVNVDDIELALGTENTSDLPDVSLVSNKLRTCMTLNDPETSTELNVRKDMSLSTITQNRTWAGLNPHDTRPPVTKATEGRKGTPSSGYTVTDTNYRT